jgi:hypothetical protein
MDAAAAATAAGDEEQDQARLDAIADGLQTRDAYALLLYFPFLRGGGRGRLLHLLSLSMLVSCG